MNFLSHYYFDKNNQNSKLIIGTILPDLLKNAHKSWNIHPQKKEHLFEEDPYLKEILMGWKRHLMVDKLFHSSVFFETQTGLLKQMLLPILTQSPVRPSFLAHIGVELVLDHLLVTENRVDLNQFYAHLNHVEDHLLNDFLNKNGLTETEKFFKFLNSFKTSRYLFSYAQLENVSYALQRICMRIWAQPFSEETLNLLTAQLHLYKALLAKNYQTIFDEIEAQLLV